MIVLKYEKKDEARFISHIDMLRNASRILRRAEIPVKYSQGFNPHALVFFSPPAAVGVSSVAEYIAIDTDMTASEVFKRYNDSVVPALRAVKCFECEKNPNLQARIIASDYVFGTPFLDIDLSDGFKIEYLKKGQSVCENAADKIFCIFNMGGKLAMRLASGNVSLRPDRVLTTLNDKYGLNLSVTDIVKTEQYVNFDGKIITADEYLKSCEVRI